MKIRAVDGIGIATIWDADILIWAATQITEADNRGETPSRRLQFHPYALLRAIRRPIGGDHYKRIEDACRRLKSTYVETNVGGGQARDGDVSILARISGSDMAAERGAVHLHGTGEHGVARLRRHGLPQLVHQHEGGLVLHVEITGELDGRQALGRIHDQADRGQQVDERQFARGEDSPRGDAELAMTGTRAGLDTADARGRKGGRKPVATPDKLARARAQIQSG